MGGNRLTDAVDLCWYRRQLLITGGDSVDLPSGFGRQNRPERTGPGGACSVALARHLGPDRLHRQHSSALLGQLGACLGVRVEQSEVGYDDRHRQRDRQHTGDCAHGADQHAEVGLGHEVAVADGRHRHDRPPQADRDRVEVVLGVELRALGVEDERRVDDDAEHEEIDEHEQLVRRRLERVNQYLARIAHAASPVMGMVSISEWLVFLWA